MTTGSFLIWMPCNQVHVCFETHGLRGSGLQNTYLIHNVLRLVNEQSMFYESQPKPRLKFVLRTTWVLREGCVGGWLRAGHFGRVKPNSAGGKGKKLVGAKPFIFGGFWRDGDANDARIFSWWCRWCTWFFNGRISGTKDDCANRETMTGSYIEEGNWEVLERKFKYGAATSRVLGRYSCPSKSKDNIASQWFWSLVSTL